MNHAYTLSELNGGKALAAAVKDSNGYYTAVYLKSGSGDFAYSNLLGKVSGATGIDGLYIQTGSVTLSKDSSSSWICSSMMVLRIFLRYPRKK